jgi:oxygen-independent coproporphyrinogen III oxidase
MFSRLYIHIPFCLHKCSYCAFVSQEGSPAQREAYVERLLAEMRLAHAETPADRPLESIYFGGGTPSLLEPGQIGRILSLANSLFVLSPHAEITLEANPGTIDEEILEGFRSSEVNRLSLGVQSFDDRMLATLGRIHSAAQAEQAVKAARAAGFGNIGIDLIHALPDQTMEMWRHDLRRALELAPQHLSIYGLSIEEGTPFARRYAHDRDLPDEDLNADMFLAADDVLTSAGYEHYEIANYALPGFRSRHNSGYWRRDGYLGLGAGAHSLLRGTGHGIRFGNSSDIDEYAAAISRGQLPRQERVQLSLEDALAEFMFLGLRMLDGVTFGDFRREFGMEMKERFGKELDELTGLGLLAMDKEGVRLTRRGMLLSNQVFTRFLE